MRKRSLPLLIVFILSISGMTACGRGLPPGTVEFLSPEMMGMAKMHCSGVLVDLHREADAPAVVLTNGHCVPMVWKAENSHEAYFENVPFERDISVGTPNGMMPVHSKTTLFATMRDTDVALVELQETNRILATSGAKIYSIAKTPAPLGGSVHFISGYWKKVQNCQVDSIVPKVLEHAWTWKQAIALTSNCVLQPGDSGSPLIDDTTDAIVGVINTTVSFANSTIPAKNVPTATVI